MSVLRRTGPGEAIAGFIASGRKTLGICLGCQVDPRALRGGRHRLPGHPPGRGAPVPARARAQGAAHGLEPGPLRRAPPRVRGRARRAPPSTSCTPTTRRPPTGPWSPRSASTAWRFAAAHGRGTASSPSSSTSRSRAPPGSRCSATSWRGTRWEGSHAGEAPHRLPRRARRQDHQGREVPGQRGRRRPRGDGPVLLRGRAPTSWSSTTSPPRPSGGPS